MFQVLESERENQASGGAQFQVQTTDLLTRPRKYSHWFSEIYSLTQWLKKGGKDDQYLFRCRKIWWMILQTRITPWSWMFPCNALHQDEWCKVGRNPFWGISLHPRPQDWGFSMLAASTHKRLFGCPPNKKRTATANRKKKKKKSLCFTLKVFLPEYTR